MRQLTQPTPAGDWFSVAVCSDGSYGIEKGLIFSFPVRSDGSRWQIVQGLKLTSVTLPYAQAVSTYNGIQVTQQATVPTFFARALGIRSATISATSKAGAGGGSQAAQYNVMIILDTTASMNSTAAFLFRSYHVGRARHRAHR